MPPKSKAADAQFNLQFLFDKTRVLLSLSSATPVSSLTSLLFEPLQLAESPPADEDSFRVCKRVETQNDGVYSFVPLKTSDGTITKAIGGNQQELLFIQFKHPSNGAWLPLKVTIPTIEDQPLEDGFEDADVDEGAEMVLDDDDEPALSGGKGKGRAIEID